MTAPAFHHEALFYAGQDEFLAGTVPFIEEGIAAGEPILVAVDAGKIARLKAELNGGSDRVGFVDMLELGRNPGCIIPAWRDFVAEHCAEDRPVRGIGEPIWAQRTPAEMVECHRHEWLLNLAFAGAPAWRLVCPYDTTALDDAVLESAHHTHPTIAEDGVERSSDAYVDPGVASDPFHGPLPEPSVVPAAMTFTQGGLSEMRSFVSAHAHRAGLDAMRSADLVLAVSELATNSVRHAGGAGTLRVWREGDSLLCEVADEGRIDEPLVGRQTPQPGQASGRGLWLANHLCDLVQLRSLPGGNVARLHMSLD